MGLTGSSGTLPCRYSTSSVGDHRASTGEWQEIGVRETVIDSTRWDRV